MGKYDKDNRTVVFDIDGVIASAPERGGHEKEVCAYVEGRFGKNFLADHSIEAAGYIHLVYPGIPEFIRCHCRNPFGTKTKSALSVFPTPNVWNHGKT